MGTEEAEAVAAGRGVALEVLDGAEVRVKVGFFVGDSDGAVICAGVLVGLDLLALAVSEGGTNELAVGEKVSVATLAGT